MTIEIVSHTRGWQKFNKISLFQILWTLNPFLWNFHGVLILVLAISHCEKCETVKQRIYFDPTLAWRLAVPTSSTVFLTNNKWPNLSCKLSAIQYTTTGTVRKRSSTAYYLWNSLTKNPKSEFVHLLESLSLSGIL